jgi:hypothetical protein
MAIADCFAFQREISSSVLWEFFDSICHKRKSIGADVDFMLDLWMAAISALFHEAG